MTQMLRDRLGRLSLLDKFSLLSLACLVVLGGALGQVLSAQIERHALHEAEAATEAAARIVTHSVLAPNDLRRGISSARMPALDSELKAENGSRTVVHAKIYDRLRRVVYSDDRGEIGDVGDGLEPGKHDGLSRALDGYVSSEVEAAADGEPALLEVYVPLRFDGKADTAGAFELYLPYAPTAAKIAKEKRLSFGILAGGLLLLFLALFRIVAAASNRLRRQADENRHQALHDALTGLPNRTLLYSLGDAALTAAGSSLVAVLLVDLDRFKEVNDTLGHDCGDRILCEVAGRMTREVRHDDVLARLGGDEFAVLLPRVADREAAREVARRMVSAFDVPFTVGGFTVQLEASVGVALAPEHGTDIRRLIQRADVAMYDGKRGRTGIEVYDAERDPYTPERLQLVGELRSAIDLDQLELHFQPQLDLLTGEVTGAEALVRWRHPERGLLPSSEFIPLAERTASIRNLTLWVVNAALSQCRRWHDEGLDLSVAVNLAGPNANDLSLPDAVHRLLELRHVPPESLELEVSESTVMPNSARSLEVLDRFHGMGVRLSLDDFGTGHSSLGYLRRLPLDRVKIDRSFVLGMTDHDDDAEIVRWTIDLARSLRLDVVAEGVETAQVLDLLTDLGCPSAQGYFIARPLPADDFMAWMHDRSDALGAAVETI